MQVGSLDVAAEAVEGKELVAFCAVGVEDEPCV